MSETLEGETLNKELNALFQEVDKVEVNPDREKTEDEKLKHGPQDEDKALAQAEIDAVFD